MGKSGCQRLMLVVAVIVVVLGACGSSPEVPLGPDGQPDPVLDAGRVVYGQNCTVCHGGSGQGGRGKKLNDGQIFELHPEIDTMLTVVAEGKGSGMPAFGEKLDAAEVAAVARYIREVLN